MKDWIKAVLYVAVFPITAPIVALAALIEKRRLKRQRKKEFGYWIL